MFTLREGRREGWTVEERETERERWQGGREINRFELNKGANYYYLCISMEVAMISTIKLIQHIIDITSSMWVDDIKNNKKPKTVCLIHKVLEFVWCPVATGGGKEGGHMITKAAIVGMLWVTVSGLVLHTHFLLSGQHTLSMGTFVIASGQESSGETSSNRPWCTHGLSRSIHWSHQRPPQSQHWVPTRTPTDMGVF